MTMDKPVMVIGGTGRVGAIAVRRFIAAQHPVSFTTRSADQIAMFGTAARGVVTDFDRRDGLDSAFRETRSVLMINGNNAHETDQGLNIVSAMQTAGVTRVVYVSVIKAMPHHFVKAPIEAALAAWGVPCTIFRPNFYNQFDLTMRKAIVDEGVYPERMGLIGVNRIDCRDIVDAAFPILTATHETHGDHELHGPDAVTGPATAALYQKALGTPVRYVGDLPAADQQKYVARSEMGKKFDAYYEEGRAKVSAEAIARTKKFVGHSLRHFADFAPEAVAAWKAGDNGRE